LDQVVFVEATGFFFVWTPDEMTRNPNLTPQERGAKNKQRMLHVSYRAEMQKMLSPWNVAIVAETFEKVTIEDWLLRVRKTVVVDGNDELFTQEAILKALNEEEEYLKQLKLKEEEAKKKHLLLQQQQKEEDYKKNLQLKQSKAEKADQTIKGQIKLRKTTNANSNNTNGDNTNNNTTDNNNNTIDNNNNAIDNNNNNNENVDNNNNNNLLGLSPDDANLTSDNETEYEEEEDDNNDDNIAEKKKEEIIEPVVVEVVLTPEEIEKIEQERKKKEEEEKIRRIQREKKY